MSYANHGSLKRGRRRATMPWPPQVFRPAWRLDGVACDHADSVVRPDFFAERAAALAFLQSLNCRLRSRSSTGVRPAIWPRRARVVDAGPAQASHAIPVLADGTPF